MTENKHLCSLVAEILKPVHQANNLCSHHCALIEIPVSIILDTKGEIIGTFL